MNKIKFTFLFALLSVASVFAQTVVDVVVNSPAHNTLETAVIEAELVDALSGDGPFTVFAPTDDAFDMLDPGVLDALLADPTGDLARILLYHVVGGEIMSTDLSDGQSATTLLGQNIEVAVNMDGVFINGAKVEVADIPATNGVVHVLDAVILPPASTIVDVVVNSDVHTTLETAVVEAGLANDLSGDGPFTLFAPTDAAFEMLDDGVLDALLMDPTGDLADILRYHVVSGEILSTDLSDGDSAPTLQGNNINVTINSDGVFINEAEVIIADIRTFNGVVHVIDAVLSPSTTSVNDLNETSMQVSPNPATEVLNLELPTEMLDGSAIIQMVNVTGQVMDTWTPDNKTMQLNVSQYPAGIYFLLSTTDSYFAKTKVVVK